MKGKQNIMFKRFKYRLYPTKKQIEKLQCTLDHCRELYNAALQERRDAYNVIRRQPNFYDAQLRKQAIQAQNINYFSQANQLPQIKQERTDLQDVYSKVLQDVLRRVNKAFNRFFLRVNAGSIPGYPRFKGRDRYNSFTYPQGGFSVTNNNHLSLVKIGDIKVKLHRPIEGIVKTCTVKREGGHWYVTFACEVDIEPLLVNGEAIGIDLGLLHFATLSDGSTIENPRYYRKSEKKLVKLQQVLARKKRGSHRRKKAVQKVAKAHRKIRNQRHDFLHKESRKLVNTYSIIVFEDLQPVNLSKHPKPKQDENGVYIPNGAGNKSGLNKSIQDAGWAEFVMCCSYKAECAGTIVIKVNPKYTSQVCSSCGTVRKKELSERWHSCKCGAELDRDHNAALNILRLGRSQRGAICVETRSTN